MNRACSMLFELDTILLLLCPGNILKRLIFKNLIRFHFLPDFAKNRDSFEDISDVC